MTSFKSIAISSPKFESNHLRYITVKSENLKGRGDITVFVPPGKHQHLPMVLLLHGVCASHWAWTQLAGVHLQLLAAIKQGLIKPMVLVMPSDGLWGDGTGYLPHKQQNFEAWIMEDVIQAVIQSLEEVSHQSLLCIAGLSMGGYGALRLGAKYGTRFKAISGLSSITHTKQMQALLEEDMTEILQKNNNQQSVLEVILNNKDILPPLRFDCGTEDSLMPENRELHNELLKNNIPHIYQEFKGAHDWTYWSGNILKTLLFFNEILWKI